MQTLRISVEQVAAIYTQPFMDLVYKAATTHRANFPEGKIQLSTLLSIKTGACPEDCGYCAQSSRYETTVAPEPLMNLQEVISAATCAKDAGSGRFCMGAAWRRVADKDLPSLLAMVREVKALGLETCMTLGTLTPQQANALRDAGLDYYNHNLDTSREYYKEVITTRGFDERLETLAAVRDAGIKVCSGGILGMGESRQDRVAFLAELANLPSPPESVPINRLVPIPGTPLADEAGALIEPLEFVRAIATARLLMPKSYVRLSAGRETMSRELQALCFMAGANSVFFGDKLLTTGNPAAEADLKFLEELGLKVETSGPQHQNVSR